MKRSLNNSLGTQRGDSNASGDISYTEQGAGPVALFLHGVLLNGHLWRNQPAHLSDSGAASAWTCLRMVIPRSHPHQRGTLEAMLADKRIYRSPQALGPAYEHPEDLSDDSIEAYLRPFLRTQ